MDSVLTIFCLNNETGIDLGGCYPAWLSASVDNTLLDVHSSPYHVQPHYGS